MHKPAEQAPVSPAEHFKTQAATLGNLLLRQAQNRNGQIDVLSMELKLTLLQEHVQLLTDLLIQATGSTLTIDGITDLMNRRLDLVIAQIDQATKAPLIAVANGMPPRAGRH